MEPSRFARLLNQLLARAGVLRKDRCRFERANANNNDIGFNADHNVVWPTSSICNMPMPNARRYIVVL